MRTHQGEPEMEFVEEPVVCGTRSYLRSFLFLFRLLRSLGIEVDQRLVHELSQWGSNRPIAADDVTCAHGATIGQLDERALFYLRSPGVDATLARTMLSFAFLADVVGGFPQASVSGAARAALEQAFSAASALAS